MKKFLTILMAAICAMAVLTSCTSTSNSKATTAPTTAPKSDSSAATGGVLKVGVDAAYPPMEYVDEKTNQIVGFDVDLANELGKVLGKKVEFVNTAWDGIFQSLKTDKFDCIISSVSITAERQEEFLLTKPYIANSQVIIVKADNDKINTIADLAGKNVGVQVSTTAHDSANKILEKTKFNLKTYDQVIMPFADMKTGRLDAIIVDEVVGRYYLNADKGMFKVASEKLTNEPIAVCIKKENTKLFDEIQKGIDQLKANGKFKELSEKWFGSDLVSQIDEKLKELE